MQTLNGNGITLTPLNEFDLELVRNWRNSPQIANNMEFRGYIGVDDQINWFKNLDCKSNYYFVVSYQSKKIGLIHLNKIDTLHKSAHAGLFIAENEFTGTGISLGASLLILSFGFNNLKLQTIYAKIKQNNTLALQYNTGLGFVFDSQLNNEFCLYKLTKANFEAQKPTLEKLAKVI